jgi:hypothetical protein
MRTHTRLAAVAVLLCGLFIISAGPAGATVNTCVSNVQNPHVNGAGRIDVTTKYKCNTGTTNLSGIVVLYKCPSKPPSSPTEFWVMNNCNNVGQNARVFNPPTTGTSFGNPITAPVNSTIVPPQNSWFIVYSEHTTSGSASIVRFGNAVFL